VLFFIFDFIPQHQGNIEILSAFLFCLLGLEYHSSLIMLAFKELGYEAYYNLRGREEGMA